MENKPKKSKALIITIIAIIILLIVGYLIFKNKDSFGVKTSASISKIFSPLLSSNNSKNLKQIDENSKKTLVQAGENIKKGDEVSVFGSGIINNNPPIVMKAGNNDDVYGFANQDILSGDIGEVILSSGSSNTFWDSFSGFLSDLFNKNKNITPSPEDSCLNGANNFPLCTTIIGGECINGANNPPECTTTTDNLCINGANNPPLCTNGGSGNQCTNGTDNFPMCTTIGGVCVNGEANPPMCITIGGGECTNGTDNFPMCTTINGQCPRGEINPPMCSNNGSECTNGADNFPMCTTIGGECVNGETNPPMCISDINNGIPDLTAGIVTPISTMINTPTILSSIITNIGGRSTGNSFSSFFSIKNTDESLNENFELNVVIPTLEARIGNIATVSHSFSSVGTYSIRACADKSSSADTGTIVESNENNNCGPFAILTITSSLPEPDDLPQCSDEEDNDNDGLIDDADPNCHIDGNLDKDYVPTHYSERNSPVNPAGLFECNDRIDNDGNNDIDASDPNCHIGGDIYETYVPEHDSETNSPVIPIEGIEENKCRVIEENPLTFTPEEKARLAVLLRKFYLISSTLRTSDDISTIYNEIDQQKNFISQIEGLTSQCYAQVDGNNLMNINPEWVRHGNPWYPKASGGSFPYTNENVGYAKIDQLEGTTGIDKCKVISGYYYGVLTKDATLFLDPAKMAKVASGKVGDDCNVFNKPFYETNTWGYGDCLGQGYFLLKRNGYPFGQPDTNLLNAGCKWKDGILLENTERILNIW